MEMRRSIYPLRDMLTDFITGESELIDRDTRFYIEDLHYRTIRATEEIASLRDTLTVSMEFSISLGGYTMTQVMRTLTIFASIFIPITFVAGIFGMNIGVGDKAFFITPEYFAIIVIAMTTAALIMLWYFKQKGFLGTSTKLEK